MPFNPRWTAADRATRPAEQLLTLSRLESGAAPQRQPVALGAQLQQVLAQCAPLALSKGQVLELEMDVSEP